MKNRALVLAAMAAMVVATGCSDDTTTNPSTSTLKLNFTGLRDLGTNALYEGWLVVGGTPKSTGTFTVSPNGVPSKTEFTVNTSDLSVATTFILTVEPNDGNPAPSTAHLLAGTFTGTSASLTVSHVEAIGTSFTSSTGTFLLATPTDGMGTNEKSGIWFLQMGSPAPTTGLQLPLLPTGWIYEGWAVVNGRPITTGKFSNVNTADMSAPYSGPLAGPPFPGEDFLQNAPSGLTFPLDLSGGVAVITIEPSPDYSPDPFILKPLTGDIPAGATPGTNYSLTYDGTSIPTGTATR